MSWNWHNQMWPLTFASWLGATLTPEAFGVTHAVKDLPEYLKMFSIDAQHRLISEPLRFLSSTPLEVLPRSKMAPPLVHIAIQSKTNMTTLQLLAVASWLKSNPDHFVLLYDDNDILCYIRTYFPQHLPLLQRLTHPVQKADVFRYLVACGHGGAYADSDTFNVWPISDWNTANGNEESVVLGIENVWRSVAGQFRMQIVQWTFLAAPGHPIFCEMGSRALAALEKARHMNLTHDDHILYTTGPGAFSRSVFAYWEKHRSIAQLPQAYAYGGKAKDVRILSPLAFGCATKTFTGTNLPGIFVFHAFRGDWRAAKAHL